MMISTLTKPTRRPSRHPHPHPRETAASHEIHHDPAGLSAALRELAVRAHRAVRAAECSAAANGLTSGAQSELVELHAQIVKLQRSLQAQALDGLAPYVAALRQKVESLVNTNDQ